MSAADIPSETRALPPSGARGGGGRPGTLSPTPATAGLSATLVIDDPEDGGSDAGASARAIAHTSHLSAGVEPGRGRA